MASIDERLLHHPSQLLFPFGLLRPPFRSFASGYRVEAGIAHDELNACAAREKQPTEHKKASPMHGARKQHPLGLGFARLEVLSQFSGGIDQPRYTAPTTKINAVS